jgi:CubicO group peptidase (beta-lactamase class C family)
VSGKSLTEFISDELTTPLGADFQLGVPEKDWSRTADVIPPPPKDLEGVELNPVALKVYAGPPMDATISSTPAFRGAEIGGAGGFSNARALARIGSIVSLGGAVDGKQYLSADTID